MPIPDGFYVKPAPNIRRFDNPPYNGSWVCKGCAGIDTCYCLDGIGDPICDCGWPAYACQCNNGEEELTEDGVFEL